MEEGNMTKSTGKTSFNGDPFDRRDDVSIRYIGQDSDRDHDSEPCCERLTGEQRMLFMRALTVRVQRLAHSARANLVE
jgi:hypothetical protein